MMISSGFWNYRRIYCFRLSLNFLYWSLTYHCLAVVYKNAPKSSTSTLNVLINYVYAGRLKCLPCPPHTLWPPLPVWPPQPCTRPPFLALNSLIVSETQVIVASLPSHPLLPAEGEAVSVSKVIVIHLSFLNNFELSLLSSFRVIHNPTHLQLSNKSVMLLK